MDLGFLKIQLEAQNHHFSTEQSLRCLFEDNQRLSIQEMLHLRDLAPCTAFWRLSLPKVGTMEGPSGSHGRA